MSNMKLIRFSLFLLVLIIGFGIIAGGRGCPKRKKDKVGSSRLEVFLSPPSNLRAQAISYNQIDLVWDYNGGGTLTANGFEIERSINSNNNYSLLTTVSINITSYPDPGPFLPFTTYYYRLRAFNTIGDYSDYSNEASAITIRSEWGAITAGEGHTLALNNNGTIWSWGWNENGQLGLDDYSPTVTFPTQIGIDTDWSMIEAGYYHSLSIKTDSTLWSWGNNEFGQLGLGDTESDRYAPEQVGTDSDWSQVTGGGYHTIGLKSNGTIWSWGINRAYYNGSFILGGQLGLGNTIDRWTPALIGTDTDWSTVTSGYYYSLSIKSDATLWAWGWNFWGQLGDNTTTTRITPRQIGAGSDWLMVSGGYTQTVALKTNYTHWWWGAFYEIPSEAPSPIGSDSDWLTVAGGGDVPFYAFTIARKTGGTLWSWGWNSYGQLGLGNTNDRYIPARIGNDTDWSEIATSSYHTVALKSNGTIYLWGGNQYGQLGLGDTINRNMPCPLGSPAPPSSLKITATALSQIDLSWTDNANNELGFKIERKTGESGTWTQIYLTGPDVTTYLDTGLNSAYTYYYRIRVYNDFGNSPYAGGSANFTNVAPSSLNATVISSSQINLVWNDNSSNETGFKIERRYDGPGTYIQIDTVSPDFTLYSDTTVTPGNTYYYQVRAYNVLGDSPASNEVAGISFVVAPSSLAATASSSSQVDLVWTDVNGKADYKIERKIGTGGSYQQIATVSDIYLYSDTPLTPSTTYYYRVRAYNAGGNSAYSPVAIATTPEGPPGAPASLIAYVISPTQINLVWTNVSSEIGYKIERSFGAPGAYVEISTVNADVLSYPDMTVTPSNTYYYRVRAYSLLGDGPYSDETYTGTTPLRPLSGDPSPTGSDVYTMTAGYRFSSDINGKIIALGRYAGGSGGNTRVCLWNDTGTGGIDGQGLLISTTVSSSAGWQWANLLTPINISAGTVYRVSVSCTTYWIDDFDFTLPSAKRGNITISIMCFMDGALDVFPDFLEAGMGMFGWADIAFVAE